MHLASTAGNRTWPAPKAIADPDHAVIAQENARLRLMTNELNHRLKNLVTAFQAIARQTMRQATTKEDFEARFSGRLTAYGHSLNLLIANDWRDARIDELVCLALSPFGAVGGERISARGAPFGLNSATARSIGLALHELATNATKYGALSVLVGRVAVRWGLVSTGGRHCFRITWDEAGGPMVKEPTHRGFGLQVVQQLTTKALAGKVTHKFRPAGVKWTLDIPASSVVEVRNGFCKRCRRTGRHELDR